MRMWGGGYAFDTRQENLLKLEPNFKKDHSQYPAHSKNADIKALEFLEKTYGIKLYCLCPNSSLANFIELAPNLNSKFIPQEKANYTKDILLPSKEAYAKFSNLFSLAKESKEFKFKKNIYYKIIRDLVKLPSDIKHYHNAKKRGMDERNKNTKSKHK